MNWNEYIRGYDDSWEDYRSSKVNNGLLSSLIQLPFSIIILVLRITWYLMKELAWLLWTMVKLIARRKG